MATMHVHMTQFSAPYIITCYIGIRNTYSLIDFEDKELVCHWLYCFTAGSKITTALLSDYCADHCNMLDEILVLFNLF